VQPAHRKYPILRVGLRLTAQQHIDAGHKLFGLKWLREIVVGPYLEAAHLVLVVAEASEHEDGRPHAIVAGLAKHFKPVEVW